jgi:N-acetylneuraminate synthase
MSGNHNQSLDRALAMVDAAASAGVQAIKLQTFTPDSMTLDLTENEFVISDESSLWHGSSLYSLYQQAQTPWEWHAPIFARARKLDLIAFSSPFDLDAVDFLEDLDAPCYKIASFENTDLPLIEKVAKTGKPIIISTGMASEQEIKEAVTAAREGGCRDLILLKCTSTYPASPRNTNLRTIPHMRNLYNCEVGLSDHTVGLGVPIASISLGATVIEKHFTLSRKDGGVDSEFSIEPPEMRALVDGVYGAWQSLGQVCYGPVADEIKSLQFRRSLYVVEDVESGEIITGKNVRSIRPGLGLAPKYLEEVLGRKFSKKVKKGTALSWGLLDPINKN